MLKLTVFSAFLFACIISFSSCEKEAERKKVTEYTKSGIPMTGAQETPANPSPAQGSVDVFYSKASKTLTYKVTWSGLTDTIVGFHIHGLAPTGFAAPIVQNILTTKNEALFPFRGGTYSGFLYVDGVKVKEEDLLNHLYYVNIHTQGRNPATGGTYAAGEIRGQIRFQ